MRNHLWSGGFFNPNLRGRTISSLLTGFTKPTTVQLQAVEIKRRLYTNTPHTLLTYTDVINTHSELYTIHGTCVNSRKRVPEQFNSRKLGLSGRKIINRTPIIFTLITTCVTRRNTSDI